MVSCILCHSSETKAIGAFQDITYYQCCNCRSVYKDPGVFLSPEAEKERYLLHQNDVGDIHYQKFVSPIIEGVLKHFNSTSTGLDFGAGTGPVITKLLLEKDYDINVYDPFFHPDRSVLNNEYDFIACCEVIEHFHDPLKEFKLLYKLLKPGGKLFCMTELLPEPENFEGWYYKKDPTHVIFYSEENLYWIKRNCSFSKVSIEGRLVVFSK